MARLEGGDGEQQAYGHGAPGRSRADARRGGWAEHDADGIPSLRLGIGSAHGFAAGRDATGGRGARTGGCGGECARCGVAAARVRESVTPDSPGCVRVQRGDGVHAHVAAYGWQDAEEGSKAWRKAVAQATSCRSRSCRTIRSSSASSSATSWMKRSGSSGSHGWTRS